METQHWSQVWNIHLLNDRCYFSDDRTHIPPVSLAPVVVVTMDHHWVGQRSGLMLRGNRRGGVPYRVHFFCSHVARKVTHKHREGLHTGEKRQWSHKAKTVFTACSFTARNAGLLSVIQNIYSICVSTNSLSLVPCVNLYPSIKHKRCTVNKIVSIESYQFEKGILIHNFCQGMLKSSLQIPLNIAHLLAS